MAITTVGEFSVLLDKALMERGDDRLFKLRMLWDKMREYEKGMIANHMSYSLEQVYAFRYLVEKVMPIIERAEVTHRKKISGSKEPSSAPQNL